MGDLHDAVFISYKLTRPLGCTVMFSMLSFQTSGELFDLIDSNLFYQSVTLFDTNKIMYTDSFLPAYKKCKN